MVGISMFKCEGWKLFKFVLKNLITIQNIFKKLNAKVKS
jgi:hypothetical protein